MTVDVSVERLISAPTEGPFPMTTVYTWSPTADVRTRMTVRNHGEPSGFNRLAAPLLQLAMRRAMNQDLAQLASILERVPG